MRALALAGAVLLSSGCGDEGAPEGQLTAAAT